MPSTSGLNAATSPAELVEHLRSAAHLAGRAAIQGRSGEARCPSTEKQGSLPAR